MLALMGTSTVALLLACAGFVGYDLWTYQKSARDRLQVLAEMIGNTCTGYLDFNDNSSARETLAALRVEKEVLRSYIYRTNGLVFTSYTSAAVPEVAAPPIEHDTHHFSAPGLRLFQDIRQKDEVVGTIYLEARLPEVRARLVESGILALVLSLLSGLAAFGVSSWLQRFTANPILHLVAASREVATKKDYSLRVKKETDDELGILIDDFNEMLAQIETGDNALRQAQAALEQRVTDRTEQLRSEVEVRQQAEEEREAERDFALQVMTLMGEGLAVLDAQDHFTFANPALAELLDWPPEALLKRPLADFVIPADRERLAEQARLRVEGKTSVIEVTLSQAGAGGRNVQITTVPRWRDGECIGTIATVIDLTEYKRGAEALLRAKEAAERADRAKSEFLATMSHEIRTPMNGILGMNELLRQTALDPRQKEYADTVAASGEALLRIINDILDLSKIEAGRMTLANEEFDPRLLVEDVVNLVGRSGPEKPVQVRAEYANLPAARLRGDSGRLRQVLLNLVGNGFKFTSQGQVVAQVFAEDAAPGQIRLRFTVTDTGEGIAPEHLSRLFQPFQQVDSSAARRHGGTGLGLVISRRLVEMMGGHLNVESEPGRGSVFWFELTFPVVQPPLPESTLAGLPVLVAMGQDLQRRLTVLALAKLGCRAQTADDPADLLAQLARGPIPVVVFDWNLAGTDAAALAGAVRAQEAAALPPRARVRLIALVPATDAPATPPGVDFCVKMPASTTALKAALLAPLADPSPAG